MKKVLVIGPRGRLDEFHNLDLKNASVAYMDQFYVDLDQVDIPFDDIDKPEDEYFIENVNIGSYDLVFDLALDDHPENLDLYMENRKQVVIGCAVKKSLGEIVHDSGYELDCKLFGMNALPTFIHRDLMELSLYDTGDRPVLEALMEDLGLAYEIVGDRVGMVTPRIICMIINEACFVLQEGTAGIADVDQAMKLGTNYPRGPFEWADDIGLFNVYGVLKAIQDDTGEEKYKVAPLLKEYYLKDKRFFE